MSRRRRGAVRAGTGALCACLLAGCLLPVRTAALAPDVQAQATLDRSVRFLQEAQNADGGFGGKAGGASDPDFSAWAAYALAAASINPRDQAQPGGVDVFTYLTRHTAELRETTDFDRVALVALASCTSPDDFGGVDPIGTILSRQLPDGSFPQRAGLTEGWNNATIWSIFPLSAVGTPQADAAVEAAADWLLDQQRPDGSWGSTTANSVSESDMTGAAVEALGAADLEGEEAQARVAAAEENAFEYLKTLQGPDGGFRELPGQSTNSASTAWVLQGMWAAGVDPREWQTESGADPLSFLASLQHPDGSIGWTANDDTNSLWMTAQVGPALAGTTYPLPCVPPEVKAPTREAPQQAVAASDAKRSSHHGHGGRGVVAGDGVIAGGGGRGARVFTAPQPQSGGSTPHGARDVEAEAAQPEDASASDESAAVGAAAQSGDEDGTGRGLGRSGNGTGGGAGAGTVEGILVGAREGRSGAAPGLFEADSGGRTETGVALGIVGALLVAALLGSRRERAGVRSA
ncbi:MAG TPA: prenyltransferase/squalene oxidase repeat-containing protein [Solirubrobacterales bacterium]|nr:prenyltransferase/squalene oxidase repeat-containing protein [Solirubrobacterales bacterium]